MQTQTYRMNCPKCYEEMTLEHILLNGDPTVFDVELIAQIEFECDVCGASVHIGDLDYEVED